VDRYFPTAVFNMYMFTYKEINTWYPCIICTKFWLKSIGLFGTLMTSLLWENSGPAHMVNSF
jgi:hypothetical protein